MAPDDGIDWEAIAKQYQIENEVYRNQINGLTMGRSNFHSYSMPSIDFGKFLAWVERNPVICIVIIYALSTLLMDVVEILQKRR